MKFQRILEIKNRQYQKEKDWENMNNKEEHFDLTFVISYMFIKRYYYEKKGFSNLPDLNISFRQVCIINTTDCSKHKLIIIFLGKIHNMAYFSNPIKIYVALLLICFVLSSQNAHNLLQF